MLSYFEVPKEISFQCDVEFDYCFLPCGTGTMTSGVICGFQDLNLKTKVCAISIARKKEREMKIIFDNVDMISKNMGKKFSTEPNFFEFHDEFIGEEYGESNPSIDCVISEVLKNEGIVMDETYSGKAFWAMTELLKEKKYFGKNILFLQTGGLFGYL